MPAGTVLFKEGDLSREVYIVQSGNLSVYRGTATREIELAKLSAGAVLGEMSLLDNQPRSASVRTLESCKLTVISEQTFVAVLKAVPAWLLAVIKVLTKRLRDTNKRIGLHTVNDALASSTLMLFHACGEAIRQGNRPPISLDLFSISDKMTVITRLRRDEFQVQLQQLMQRKLITLESSTEGLRKIVIADPELLELLVEHKESAKGESPWLPFALSPVCIEILDLLQNPKAASLDSEEALLTHVQVKIGRATMQDIKRLKAEAILKETAEGTLEVDRKLQARILKAVAHRDALSLEAH